MLTPPISSEESCNSGVEATETNDTCATISIHTSDMVDGSDRDGMNTKVLPTTRVTGDSDNS